MKDSSLVKVLKTLSAKELSEFGKFISSPFFNGADYIVRYFNEIKKFYPTFESRNFSKEYIFEKLYSGKKYNDATFRKLTSELMKLADSYLSCKNFLSSPPEKEIHLLNEYNKRNLYGVMSVKLKRVIESTKDERESAQNSLNLYKLENFNNLLMSEKGSRVKEDYEKPLRLFNEYYLTVMLKQYTELLHLKRYYDGTLSRQPVIEEVIKAMIKYEKQGTAFVHIYFKLFELMDDYNNEKIYKEILSLTGKHYKKISKGSLFNIYNELSNYCWLKIYNGELKFEKELFTLYKDMLAKDVFAEHTFFPHVFFDNMCAAGVNAGKPEWSERFIAKYKEKLRPDLKETVVAFNLAILYYTGKEFSKALEILSRISLIDDTYKVRIKADTIKNLYELGMFDSALSTIDTLKHYITNDKTTSEEYHQVFKNFALFTTTLIKAKEKKDLKDLQYLKRKINSCKSLMHKPWLLEKIVESL